MRVLKSRCSASRLCRRVLETHRQISRVRIEIAEQPWTRMDVGAKPQGQAFLLGGPDSGQAAITSNGNQRRWCRASIN